jgi:hypothetical protein
VSPAVDARAIALRVIEQHVVTRILAAVELPGTVR